MTIKDNDADIKFIKALAEVLKDNDLNEISVKRDIGKTKTLDITLCKNSQISIDKGINNFLEKQPSVSPLSLPSTNAANLSNEAADPALSPGAVISPMVGTVYLQPEPGTETFVKIGSNVREGDTLVIIEAMKTMNQIPAPQSGTIKRILVEDQAAVEYGTPLVIIE